MAVVIIGLLVITSPTFNEAIEKASFEHAGSILLGFTGKNLKIQPIVPAFCRFLSALAEYFYIFERCC